MLALLALLASAQDLGTQFDLPEMNAQLYRGPIDAKRTMWTDDAFAMPHLAYTGRFYVSYLNGPIGAAFAGDRRVAVIGDVVGVNLVGGVQLGPVRVGADVPMYVVATSGWESAGGGGLGDIAIDAKASLLDPADAPLGAAIGLRLGLPTGTVKVPLTSPSVQTELQAIVHKEVEEFLFAANVGARFGPRVEQDNLNLNDAILLRLGAAYSIVDGAGTSVDLQMLGDLSQSPADSERFNTVGLPIELMVGGYRRINNDLVIRGGVGRGLTRGIGAPNFRAVFSLGYEPDYGGDMDRDGLADKLDACPEDPEDFDDFEDRDGCPEPDNDADGMLDAADACPMDPEDPDGWQDEDGCPEPTTLVRVTLTDKAGTPVPAVRSTLAASGEEVPEEMGASFELELLPGTYALAAQAEGFVPLAETVAVENGPPMDIQRVMAPDAPLGSLTIRIVDTEGKPVPGATYALGDSGEPVDLVGAATEIGVEAGTYTIVGRAEGYVTARQETAVAAEAKAEVTLTLKASKVRVSLQKIEILEKVFFNTGKATIKPESFGLLDEVAQTLKDRPDIKRVRIEGHTDSRGSESLNQRLSEARAASVLEYLVEAGIDRGRLESKGYGEGSPVDPAENEAAWAKNRRVEFVILEQGAK